MLGRARGGATLDTLAETLVDDEISEADAKEYIAELLDSQILVADVRPRVTGDEPVHGLVATLAAHAKTARIAKRLEEVRAALEALDEEGLGGIPDRYRAVAALLAELPAQPELSRLVQVDLVKPAQGATLGPQVVGELVRGRAILHQLVPPRRSDSLSRFREQFAERYETREVPLVEALDEEAGIGFERSRSPLAEAAPLLAGLPFNGDDEEAEPWSWRDAFLLRKLAVALSEESGEIRLDARDLDNLSSRPSSALPDAFHVSATVAAESASAIERGDFRVLLQNVAGPSGAASSAASATPRRSCCISSETTSRPRRPDVPRHCSQRLCTFPRAESATSSAGPCSATTDPLPGTLGCAGGPPRSYYRPLGVGARRQNHAALASPRA